MTRDEIIALAGELAQSLQDADTLDTFINDVFHELAFLPEPPLLKALLKQITSGVATYSFESDMLRSIYAIMFDELLSPVTEQALDAYNDTWQSDSGTPTQLTQDALTARTYRLYPNPDTSSDAVIPIHGQPWGEDYPDGILALIYADDREANILDLYSLPLALDALGREFAYPSDHKDIAFADTCKSVAQLFYRLLGVK